MSSAAAVLPARPAAQALTIEDTVRDAYFRLAKAVGEFSLQGTGYARPVVRNKNHFDLIGTHDAADALRYDRRDRIVASIDEAVREAFIESNLPDVGQNQVLDSAGLDIKEPGWVELIEDFNKLLPVYWEFIQALPASMQAHKEDFFTKEFYNHLRDTYLWVLSDDLSVKIEKNEFKRDSRYVITPFSYALPTAADQDVPLVLGERSWKRGFGRHERSLVKRFKQSASISRMLGRLLGVKIDWMYKYNSDIEHLAEFAIDHQVFQATPAAVDVLSEGADLLAAYNPAHAGILSALRDNVKRNANHFRINLADIPPMELTGETGQGVYDRLIHPEYIGSQEERIVKMMDRFNRLAGDWASVCAPLIKKRTPPVDGGDKRTEGLLYCYDENFAALQSNVSSVHNAGYFYHLADLHGPKINDAIGKMPIPGGASLVIGEKQLEKAQRWMKTTQGSNVLEPPYIGKIATALGWHLFVKGVFAGYDNMLDNKDFASASEIAREIYAKFRDNGLWGGFTLLMTDLMNKDEIPDPSKVTIGHHQRVADALSLIKPACITYSKSDPMYCTLDGMLEDFGWDEYVEDNNNAPLLFTLGVLNSRLNRRKYANKFLRMADKWAKMASDNGMPADQYRAATLYELSVLNGRGATPNPAESERYLLEAWDIAKTKPHDGQPAANIDEEEIRMLIDPLNYGRKLNHMIRMRKSGQRRYAPAEVELIAKQAYAELGTILEKRHDALSESDRKYFTDVRQRFYKEFITQKDAVEQEVQHQDNKKQQLALPGGTHMNQDTIDNKANYHRPGALTGTTAAEYAAPGALTRMVQRHRAVLDQQVNYPFDPQFALENNPDIREKYGDILEDIKLANINEYGVKPASK